MKINKAIINSVNNNNKCFQCTTTVILNHEGIKKNLQRISKFKPFINKYNWKRISYPPGKDDQKRFKKNNSTITINV